jgi:2-methylcitrate dehydratase
MTEVQTLAQYVCDRGYQDLSVNARQQLKIRILDGLGCAIGALDTDLLNKIRRHVEDFGGNKLCTLIGGGASSPDHATFYNSALIRYLDFNDSYLAKGETCHPSDNLAAILAAGEYADASGEDFMAALAIAYQVQCRLSDEAPVRHRGFDHTTQGAYAVAAGVSKALNLMPQQTAHAIAISGTGNLALRVSRTGELSNWKGLAYPNTAFIGVHSAFLAMRGITGPLEVFEGNKGFKALAGPFHIDWEQEDMERVTRTIIKKYNAEIHSQSALEGALDLQKTYGFSAHEIESIEVQIFDVAYNIIGGGEEGDKIVVRTKEEADHSLRYLIAVALLDHQVFPQQYAPDRILREDVQSLLRRVRISPSADYSRAFPEKVACSLKITLTNGRTYQLEKESYEGFHTHPFSWESIVQKFRHLASPVLSDSAQNQIIKTVANMESLRVRDLTRLLAHLN